MAVQPHLVILGAGFGGLGVLERLRGADLRITLVDKHNYHTFQPLLYQVATDELAPTEVGFPLRELLDRHKNLAFQQSSVRSVDLAKKQVVLADGPPLTYDYLVIALGAVVNFFNTPGAEQFAFPMYTMEDALRLKTKILTTLERVDQNPALADGGALTFCIVGGGPTGVEVAGSLAELLQSELGKEYPNVPLGKAQVHLYEYSPDLLGPFKPALRDYARQALEKRGVNVHTGTGVKQIHADNILLSTGVSVPTQTLVWAAGLQANPLVASLAVPLAHGGRIPVDADLQISGHPGSYALGDIAAMKDVNTGAPLPGLAAVALQAGRYLGESIQDRLAGKTVKPFAYFDKGTMATIGRGAAIAELPLGISMTGLPAWLAWLGVHLTLLSTMAERSCVLVDWGWNMLTRQRGKGMLLGDEGNPRT